jgi:transcriptional regulator GlxA family with amidase domain
MDKLRTTRVAAKRNLEKPLTVADLADAAHLSPRQFSRAFRADSGQLARYGPWFRRYELPPQFWIAKN